MVNVGDIFVGSDCENAKVDFKKWKLDCGHANSVAPPTLVVWHSCFIFIFIVDNELCGVVWY